MRKLINGEYVRVDALAQVDVDPVPAGEFIDVIDLEDIEEMDKGQLIDLLQSQGVPANKRWKMETLQVKAMDLIEGRV